LTKHKHISWINTIQKINFSQIQNPQRYPHNPPARKGNGTLV
jgi:hypothetical protein